MQSNRLWASNCSCSSPRAKKCSCCGSRLTGQTWAQSPQRIQGMAGTGSGSSVASPASRQLQVLISGTERSGRAKPIIGPPISTRSRRPSARPANASNSCTGVPISASTFIGRSRAPPARVVIREISGRPRTTASCTAARVPTFWHRMPMSAGRPSAGTSLPVSNWISWRSPPEG